VFNAGLPPIEWDTQTKLRYLSVYIKTSSESTTEEYTKYTDNHRRKWNNDQTKPNWRKQINSDRQIYTLLPPLYLLLLLSNQIFYHTQKLKQIRQRRINSTSFVEVPASLFLRIDINTPQQMLTYKIHVYWTKKCLKFKNVWNGQGRG
jgi:hypothetical protein